MQFRPSTYLIAGLLSFFIFLLPCVFLLPAIFQEDLGISNYGVNPLTIVPYSLGFLASVASLLLAVQGLRSKQSIRLSLQVVAILQLALLLIPDSKVDLIRYAHVITGITLFMAEFGFASWLALRVCRTPTTRLLMALQALAGVSAFLSLGHSLNLEAPSQLVFQLAFMSICIQGIHLLEKNKNEPQ